MKLSAKWTTLSFFAVTALGAGSLLFGGCTVTSGKVDNIEGGPGNPPVDGGGGTDTSTGDSGSATCEGDTKRTVKLHSDACQNALNANCCTELIACFGQAVAADKDCNVYTSCIDNCKKPLGDGAAPTDAEFQKCANELCVANSPKSVVDAYNAILDCATAHPASMTACQ